VKALRDSAVPVPRTAALCEDPSVTGAPFAVTRFVDGRVIATVDDVHDALSDPWARRAAGVAMAETLGQLHLVDADVIGLGGLARRDGYVDRQLLRMRDVWARTATRELPLMDELATRLAASQPPQRYTGIVHCDYRLGNVMLSPTGSVVAVLDWELCTLGDVLADVGFLVNNWDGPDDDGPQLWMQVPPTAAGGFCSRTELVDRYEKATVFDVDDLAFYRAFGYWRMAVIAEGIKRRYESAAMGRGEGSPEIDFTLLESRVRHLAEAAHALL
jgi:aminoglycoside phosphotransferase (APT) family kinase protein